MEETVRRGLDGGVVGRQRPGDGDEIEHEIAVAGVEPEAVRVARGGGGGFGGDGGGQRLEGEGVDEAGDELDGLDGGVGGVVDMGDEARGEAVGEGDEEGAAAGRGVDADFDGEVREVGDAQGVEQLGLDVGEGFEGWGVGLRGLFGVLVLVDDGPGAGCEGVVVDQSRVLVVRFRTGWLWVRG